MEFKIITAFAKTYKSLHPIVLLLWRPSVPDNSESFLRSNPFVDLALHNEGEVALKALEIYASKLLLVPSASFIKDNLFLRLKCRKN